MEKEEFLKELKECLEGDIPEYEIKSHIEFYNEYFEQKIKEGKTAKDVVDEIGSPRLIAKTLKNTSNMTSNTYSKSYDYSDDYTSSDNNNNKEKKAKLKDRFKLWIFDVAFGRRQVTTGQKVLIAISMVLFFVVLLSVFYFILDLAFAIFPIVFLIGILLYFFAERR